jgi:hypothetical protein
MASTPGKRTFEAEVHEEDVRCTRCDARATHLPPVFRGQHTGWYAKANTVGWYYYGVSRFVEGKTCDCCPSRSEDATPKKAADGCLTLLCPPCGGVLLAFLTEDPGPPKLLTKPPERRPATVNPYSKFEVDE